MEASIALVWLAAALWGFSRAMSGFGSTQQLQMVHSAESLLVSMYAHNQQLRRALAAGKEAARELAEQGRHLIRSEHDLRPQMHGEEIFEPIQDLAHRLSWDLNDAVLAEHHGGLPKRSRVGSQELGMLLHTPAKRQLARVLRRGV